MAEHDTEKVTVAEAARELGVSMATLYRTLARESIPTFKRIGDRRAYVRVVDIERIRGWKQRDEGKAAA